MALYPAQQRLRDGQTVIAVNLAGRNPDVLKPLAQSGAHIAFIDCERTGLGLDAATELIRAAHAAGICPMVRSWSKEPEVLVRYLDRQASGLIVPHIKTVDDVRQSVELVRYACGAQASEKSLIVQIETVSAVENLEAIMAVPGVDAYLIGPNDLAYDMTGQRGAQTPDVMGAVKRVADRLRQDHRPFGLPANWNQLPYFQSLGANFLYFPLEWLVQHALQDLRASLGLD
jgi:2-keto-3-deoxy-L-rhamnonate aldolase RhmA